MEEIRFKIIPFLTIYLTEIFPLPNTNALGAVATGSINAQEALNVAAPSKSRAGIWQISDMGSKMGNITAVVARLEVISVVKLIKRTVDMMTNSGFQFCAYTSMIEPNHEATPVWSKAEARLNPPPNKIRVPHGSF